MPTVRVESLPGDRLRVHVSQRSVRGILIGIVILAAFIFAAVCLERVALDGNRTAMVFCWLMIVGCLFAMGMLAWVAWGEERLLIDRNAVSHERVLLVRLTHTMFQREEVEAVRLLHSPSSEEPGQVEWRMLIVAGCRAIGFGVGLPYDDLRPIAESISEHLHLPPPTVQDVRQFVGHASEEEGGEDRSAEKC